MTLKGLKDLRDVSSLSDLRSCVEKLGHDMGFPLFAYLYKRQEPGQQRQTLVALNVPAGFLKQHRDPQASRRDPVLARLRAQTMPFFYDQQTYVKGGAGDLWEEQAPFGFRAGVATAVQLSRGERLYLGYDRYEAISAVEDQRLRLQQDVSAIAFGAARVLASSFIPIEGFQAAACELSTRQLQILYWASMGHTNEEIASVLKISEQTVKNHLRDSQEKLGTTNRIHTVAEALRLNLLDDSLAELS